MRFLSYPSPCSYLPDQLNRMEYETVARLDPADYEARLAGGWRRFGRTLFRPRCPACVACRPIRIPVDSFRPDRSQRRIAARNGGDVRLSIDEPGPSGEDFDLYRRFHDARSAGRGWRPLEPDADESFAESFLDNPVPTRRWRYRIDGRLVGLGFVDEIPGGLTAIYFVHDPAEARRSLGTWNVLSLIGHARDLGKPYLYLGYYVAGCISMAYKARFRPHELRDDAGHWAMTDPSPADP